MWSTRSSGVASNTRGPAAIYNGSPWGISRRAPLVGEHNEEVYCEDVGLQRADLALLSESGVV